MGRYKKLPVEIEAFQWDGRAESATEIIEWVLSNGGTATYDDREDLDMDPVIHIRTLEGSMEAGKDWYVIKGIEGEFYPCRADIFEKTYRRDPNTEAGFIDLGPELFADNMRAVISWSGENYYRGCGAQVRENEDGSTSHCVKPNNHSSLTHEDFDGNTTET